MDTKDIMPSQRSQAGQTVSLEGVGGEGVSQVQSFKDWMWDFT